MRSLQTVLFLVATTLPVALVGCSSDSGGGGAGGTGGSTGGRGGSTGGSAGGTTGGSAGGTTGGSAGGTTGGSGGSTGGSGGSTGGSGGSSGGTGTGGTTGGTGGGADGGAAMACGAGKTVASGAVIDNFDGMKQTLEWRVAHMGNNAGTVVTPMGSLEVTVMGAETHAVGALAQWMAANRPCMDASAFQGIQFKVTATVKDLLVRLSTPVTIPVAEGGVCPTSACAYGHYQKDVTANLSSGMIQVPFSQFAAPSWAMPSGPFDKSALIAIVFLTTDTDTTKKFTIDDVSFY